ncbi:hypothetical protein FHETE_9115 [Fusarium heterosporum]|uniref:Uncharacterized protein n=1 Tax=Fusarium heterosporum TaxID=42747 RepID=A0A8H5T0J5_FUSHE|nr:hypothetical protein FHETE_9115 [Fusarium heterosporum]
MSTTVTSLLVIPSDSIKLHGKVIGADATATTYVLQCPPHDSTCDRSDTTITLGPWAEKTLAPGAAPTGVMDIWVNDTIPLEPTAVGNTKVESVPWTYSLHCQMSRSVAQECTMGNGPIEDSENHPKSMYPTQTFAGSELRDIYGPTYAYSAITLTAGLEMLDGKHASTTSATATDDSTSSEETGSTSQSTATSTGTSTGSAEAPGETNDGSTRRVSSILAVACVGLFVLAF